jgi:DNA-binding MarR family transcriptional regulator
MLGLEKEDVDYLRRLPTGHSFILIRKSVFPNPFLISFPLVPIKKGTITDTKVREAMGIRLIQEINNRKRNADSLETDTLSPVSDKTIELSTKADPSIFAQNMVTSQDIENRMKRLGSKSWDILELLVQGDASFTSEIYKQLKMSHKTFNKEVQKLIDAKFVSSRPGKVYKQTAVYYYPTHQGRLAYAMKTNQLETGGEETTSFSEKEVREMKEKIRLGLTLNGWGYIKDKDNIMLFEQISPDKVTKNPNKRKSKKTDVFLLTNERRDQIDKMIEKKSLEGEMYIVAATQHAKNLALQQLAKYAHKHHKTNILINVAVIEELKEIGFRRVEFNPM